MNPSVLLALEDASIVAAGYLAYLFVLRRLADVAQPYRLELAERGERVLAAEPSSPNARQISFYLDTAFSGWIAPMAAVLLPIATILTIVRAARGRSLPAEHRQTDRLSLLFGLSVFVANPFFGTIFLLELLVLGLVLTISLGPRALAAAFVVMVDAQRALPRWRQRSEAYCT